MLLPRAIPTRSAGASSLDRLFYSSSSCVNLGSSVGNESESESVASPQTQMRSVDCDTGGRRRKFAVITSQKKVGGGGGAFKRGNS